MSSLFIGFGILAVIVTVIVYTGVLFIWGTIRWIRGLINPAAKSTLAPVWRRKAGLPLLLWIPALAFMIPNLLEAIQRGRSQQAMADLRSVATACEAYFVDRNAYPAARSMDELARILEPKYLQTCPRRDGWGIPYSYFTRKVEGAGPQSYRIVCSGSDRVVETKDPWSYPEGATTNYADDIVYSDGIFVRYPEGRSN